MSSTDSKKFLKIEVSGIEKIAVCNSLAQGVRIFAVKNEISMQYDIRPLQEIHLACRHRASARATDVCRDKSSLAPEFSLHRQWRSTTISSLVRQLFEHIEGLSGDKSFLLTLGKLKN